MKPGHWIRLGAVLAGLAVVGGAFGAHGLPERLAAWGLNPDEISRRVANLETAARYQMYHAIGLMVLGALGGATRPAWRQAAGWCFTLGIALFSGCLYAMVFGAPKWLGVVVPIGGVAFILGWICLAAAVKRAGD